MNFYAHTVESRPKSGWEYLSDHLRDVGKTSANFTSRFRAKDWGQFVGLMHDIGKYRPEFQQRLEDTSIQAPHAAPGAAVFAANKILLPAAFAVAGHHVGLANLQDSANGPTPLAVALRIPPELLTAIRERLVSDFAVPDDPTLPTWLATDDALKFKRRLAFFTRMLFSSLVDADRLETDHFYARVENRPAKKEMLDYLPIYDLAMKLDVFIDSLSRDASDTAVNGLRARVLKDCRDAAAKPPGLFSLTVPTGGGKTLSGMSFALNHALSHDLDRVIVVIPYTSIITQNAEAYKQAFGEVSSDAGNVLEHHSGIDEQQRYNENSEAEVRRKLAAENWDAPIVVTTTVQFFESLFSNHPSRCRKLHRIAKSVIILDEVQTLPPKYLIPIVSVLNELTTNYGCSVVLSTATPPALTQPTIREGLTGVEPIVADFSSLFASPAARRVTTEWRIDQPTAFDSLALEIKNEEQVLAIVHRRQDARDLAELLPHKGRFHLSAMMCPAHRAKRIKEIRSALKNGDTCRLVSTQLIEAGVDVDFPVVYRALAGLDSLAQSAGRCDREGKRTDAAGHPAGRFVVFRAETSPPPGVLQAALQTTDILYRLKNEEPRLNGELDPFNPDHGTLFFERLYRDLDKDRHNIQHETEQFNFANVDAEFTMIDSAGMRPIVVDWEDGRRRIDQFVSHPSRQHARALQPYIVQVNARYFDYVMNRGIIDSWYDGSLGLASATLFGDWYDEDLGLLPDQDAPLSPDVMVI